MSSNCINTIAPYRHNGVWVFDDPDVGLCKEPFISGADAIIDRLVEHPTQCSQRVILIFSAEPFPGYTAELNRTRQEFGGNWYYCKKFDLEGWLCPALYKYFEVAPDRLFIAAKEHSPEGVTA